MLGIDVKPDHNGPSSISTVDGCVSVESGEEFPVDVFVNNVNDLVHWELRVGYDDSVLELQSADYNYFLVSDGSGSVFPTLTEEESDGRYFLAAAESQGEPDSGSGTLARLTMKALDRGSTKISIVASPPYLGPRLETKSNAGIGDSNGDGIWDASIVSGKVVVDGACTGNEPVVSPKPSPRATPRQTPGASGGPAEGDPPTGGGDASATPGTTSAAPAGDDDDAVANIGGGDPAGSGDGSSDDAGSEDSGGGPATGEDQPAGGDRAGEDGSSSTNGERFGSDSNTSIAGGGDGFPWLIGLSGIAVVLLAAGILLLGFARRRGL